MTALTTPYRFKGSWKVEIAKTQLTTRSTERGRFSLCEHYRLCKNVGVQAAQLRP